MPCAVFQALQEGDTGKDRSALEELIPEMSQGKHSNIGTIFFAAGFSVMMTLDVALG
jgi:hypothetical protein